MLENHVSGKNHNTFIYAHYDRLFQSNLLQTILNTINMGLLIIEADGKISLANEEAKCIFSEPLECIQDCSRYKGCWPDTGQPLAPGDWPAAQALLHGRVTRNMVVEIEKCDGTTGTRYWTIFLSPSPRSILLEAAWDWGWPW